MSMFTRAHACSEHYKLKSYNKLFTCHGCKTTGFGERYRCKLCGHELHKECRFPEDSVTHEFFERSTFTFRNEPFTKYNGRNRKVYAKICDACGKDICGFSYHCEEDNLDVHPNCLNLQKKLLINEDTVLNLKANVVSKCLWCKKKEISDDGSRRVLGWSYSSTCNKYHFHVYCMTEMVHEACMKNGEKGLEKVEPKKLVKRRAADRTVFQTIKSILKVILSALLGDPTLLISSVFVELLSRGLE